MKTLLIVLAVLLMQGCGREVVTPYKMCYALVNQVVWVYEKGSSHSKSLVRYEKGGEYDVVDPYELRPLYYCEEMPHDTP